MRQMIRVWIALIVLLNSVGISGQQPVKAMVSARSELPQVAVETEDTVGKVEFLSAVEQPAVTALSAPHIPPPPENLVLSVNVTPQGGIISLGTSGTLDIPAGAVTQTVNVQATISQTVLLTNTVNAPVHLTFTPDVTFISPVTLTIDMSGLATPETIAYFKYPLVLQWLNTSQNPAVWEEVTTSYNPTTGILQAHITHFSDYQVSLATPPTPQAWKFSSAIVNVALFRGATTYQTAIPIPAGMDGLQPSLVAEYSSAGGDTQSDGQYVPGHHWSLGKGWDLQIPNISRLIKQGFICDGDKQYGSAPGDVKCVTNAQGQTWHFQVDPPYDYYTLTFGGQSHILRLRNGNEYITEDYTPLLIRRCTNASPCASPSTPTTNSINEYWQVFTPDGTLYTFGTDANSTDTIYRPQDDTTYGRTWFVDKVYSTNRDDTTQGKWSENYEYETGVGGVTADFRVCDSACWYYPSTSDNWRRPSTITYGNSSVSSSLRYTVTFGYDWGARLGNITTSSPSGAMNKVAFGRNQARNEIDNITQQSWDGTAWQSLPTTSFAYTDVGSGKLLINVIGNGYGATTTVQYASATTVLNIFPTDWMHIVTQTILSDSATSWQRIDNYAYANPCYDTKLESNLGYFPCYTTLHHPDGTTNNALIGYDTVTHTLRETITGTAISIDAHRFYTDYMKVGKEFETRAYDGGNGLLQKSTTSYNSLTGGSLPANTWFVYPQLGVEYPLGDVAASGFSRQTQHIYTTLTDSSTGRFIILPERDVIIATTTANGNTTTQYGYNPNYSKWIVSKVAWKNIYAEASFTQWPGNFVTQDIVYYDGATNYATPPTSGLVTKVESGNTTTTSKGYTKQTASYNGDGQPQTITDGRDNSSSAGYDPSGLFVTSVTNANGKVTSYAYYGVNSETITNANGTRQPYGTLKKVTDPNNAATEYLYDVFGRLTAVAQPYDTTSNPTQAYAYTDGSPLKIMAAQKDGTGNGFSTYTFYDGLGRAIQTRAEENGSQQRVVNTKYNAQGLAAQTTAPVLLSTGSSLTGWAFTDPSTKTKYDALGRTTQIIATDGITTQWVYAADDSNSFGYSPTNLAVMGIIDANGHAKHQVTDALGRLTRARELTGTNSFALYAETSYTYDALGNLTGVSDALGNTTVITYDALGHKGYMSDPDMGAWRYGYDGNGNLTTQKDNKNQTLTFGFDALNRMTDKSVNGMLFASFGYDQVRTGAYNVGQRTSTWRKDVGTSQADYDQRGRPITITQTTDGIAFTTAYAYDSANRIKAMRYPDGENVSFGFNEAMQPNTLSGKASIVTGATYTPMGQFSQIDFGNTTSAYYTYYNTGSAPSFRLKGIEVKKGTTSHLNLQYGYDNVGNVQSLTDPTFGNVSYLYDPLDRLTSASGTVSESYTYDQIGNIKNKSDVGGYTYGTKPHAVTSAGSLSFGYDPNGNMITRTLGIVMYAQGWDAENKLIAVSSSDGAQPTTWTYDADGMRVKRTIGGKTTIYVGNYYELEISRVFVPNTQKSYSAYWKPEALSATSGKVKKYYYLGNTRVAMSEGGIMRWLQGDNLGSASLATDVLGNVTSNIRYKPFGEQRDSAAFATNRKFNGMIEEPQAGGLYTFGARMYLPKIGRFVSADMKIQSLADSQTLNRYAFVRNNPLRFTDPTGHDFLDLQAFVAGLFYGYDHANLSIGQATAMDSTTVRQAEILTNQNADFAIGRATGATVAALQGIAEMGIGAGGATGGGLLCLSGVGCIAGAPAVIASAAIATHGVVVTGNAISDIAQSLALFTKNQSSNKIAAITPPTNRRGLRVAMEKKGQPPNIPNAQAHHELPWNLRDWFAGEGRGLDVNSPEFGMWVSGTPPGDHQNWTDEYNELWRIFREANPNATRNQVLDYLEQLLNTGKYK